MEVNSSPPLHLLHASPKQRRRNPRVRRAQLPPPNGNQHQNVMKSTLLPNRHIEKIYHKQGFEAAKHHFHHFPEGMKHDLYSYSYLLKIYTEELPKNPDIWEEIKNVLKLMRKDNIKPDLAIYHQLIHLCTLSQDREYALILINETYASNIDHTLNTYNLIIELSLKCALTEHAQKAFDHIRTPNHKTFIMMIFMYCNLDDRENVQKYNRLRKERGITLSSELYTELLHFYEKQDDLSTMEEIYAEAKKENMLKKKHVDIMWDYCASKQHADMLMNLLEDMRVHNFPRKESFYLKVVRLFMTYDPTNAEKAITDMIADGFEPDKKLIFEMLQRYIDLDDSDNALKIFEKIKVLKYFVPIETIRKISIMARKRLDRFAEQKSRNQAMKLFTHLTNVNFPVNKHLYASYFKCLSHRRWIQQLKTTYDAMSIEPDESIYNIVIWAYIEAKMFTSGGRLYDEMKSKGFKPNYKIDQYFAKPNGRT